MREIESKKDTSWNVNSGEVSTLRNLALAALVALVPAGSVSAEEPLRIDNSGGTITEISGVFDDTEDGIVWSGYATNGGAISNYNNSTIEKIESSSFISNDVNTAGGAIYNMQNSKINSIVNSTFESNTVNGSGEVFGGAIYNKSNSSIGSISAEFISNSVTSSSNQAQGGAIFNDWNGSIGNIGSSQDYSVFSSNSAVSNGGIANGGAINNGWGATVGTIYGCYSSNHGNASSTAFGGAISNYAGRNNVNTPSTIAGINGDFSSNYAISSADDALGGAIYNGFNPASSEYPSTITNGITGNFSGNYAKSTSGAAKGGAIANVGSGSKTGNIDSNFDGNYAQGSTEAKGGAIYNEAGTIGNIGTSTNKVVFTDNYAKSSGTTQGGAIFNTGSIQNIVADFTNNYAEGSSYVEGGAIWNSNGSTIVGGIKADFTGNQAINTNTTANGAEGGAIYNSGGNIGKIEGKFENNSTEGFNARGGAIAQKASTINGIKGDFKGNSATSSDGAAEGGAIYNTATINGINGSFSQNIAKATGNGTVRGGAIYNSSTITGVDGGLAIEGNFIGNQAIANSADAYGGAIFNNSSSSIGNIQGVFKTNSVTAANDAQGGAIYNRQATIGAKDAAGNVTGGLINSSLIGNSAVSTSGVAQGGAVYTDSDLAFYNDGVNLEIRDNYTESAGVRDDNAIYVASEDATITFNLKNSANLLLQDNIDGVTGYNVNIVGDGSNIVSLNNEIRNADVSIGGFTLNSYDGQVNIHNFNSLTLTDNVSMGVDVDLENGVMDSFRANSFASDPDARLNITALNRLSDMRVDQDVVDIYFVGAGMKDNVNFNIPEKDSQTGLVSYVTPIYKYNAIYDNGRDDAGYLVFTKGNLIPVLGGGTVANGNASNAFNPAVLGGATSATVGALTTMNQAFNYSFQNADSFMNIPYLERMAIRDRNKYAIAPISETRDGVQTFSPLMSRQETNSVWVRPYASFESVDLRNGPKVSNISYGTLIGFDTDMESIMNGWDRVFTGYIGYNGASQRYSGVDSYQNGGMLGGTMTLYKGNFFNATTLSSGALVASNTNMYGSEDFAMLTAGIGNKSGYNFEFKEGKVILQPSMLMSYTFVNTFDYTNGAGIRIDNKPLHAISLVPGVKLIGNTKNGWQPYASVSMVWNLMGKSDSYANGIHLPSMSIKPYVQYGVGIQKRIKDRFMGYGQAMILNGGRTGVSLAAGFRWALGKEGAPIQKVEQVKSKPIEKTSAKPVEPKFVNSKAQKTVNKPSSFIKTVETDKKGEISQMEYVVNIEKPARKVIKEMSENQKMSTMLKHNQLSNVNKYSTLKQL